MKRNMGGFSLLELMITVGIVAALAAGALAGYGYATQKTRRAAAQGCLTEWAGRMERYYTSQMTYQGGPTASCSADVSKYYTVAFDAGSPAAMTYTLVATPKGGQRKDSCGTLKLDSKNVHTPTTAGCW
jgi:type IV pilus assembly protein PilE